MADHARSSDPAVQTQLDRLWALSPGADVLGLERITRLLARLGDPHRHVAPVFHVAGTNGKGSTCAFLRTAMEAAGYRVHAYTSPHLVRFNERIRLAGRLIDDAALAALLAEVLAVAEDLNASFFEVTTAAMFLAFARDPADACVIEVGLGGRLDATNVVPRPLVCGIAQLGVDHQSFLGDTATAIAAEKAGIARAGVPLVTMAYPDDVAAVIADTAARVGAPVVARDRDWYAETIHGLLHYRGTGAAYVGPLPAMAGAHQVDNLALAIAMLRHQQVLAVPDAAIADAATATRWPARMQRLASGPLTARVAVPVWLDGAHNPAAAQAVGAWWQRLAADRPTAIVLGLLANKDAAGVLDGLRAGGDAPVVAVPVPDHAHHDPADLARLAGPRGIAAASVAAALDLLAARQGPDAPCQILIAGSLYLAGTVLAANDQPPD